LRANAKKDGRVADFERELFPSESGPEDRCWLGVSHYDPTQNDVGEGIHIRTLIQDQNQSRPSRSCSPMFSRLLLMRVADQCLSCMRESKIMMEA
jgi:hypothetical protein